MGTNLLRFQPFWKTDYIPCMQIVVPELEIVCNLLKYHTFVFFPHFESWNEDLKYMGIISEDDEGQCICLLPYGLD